MMGHPFALYIHVPFCAHKCPYCDFNTYATAEVPEERYVKALLAEIERYALDPNFSGREISSVFWGGGTPSMLSPDAIQRVMEGAHRNFPLVSGAEITLEANPSHPSKARYVGYREAGINRVSFGVQSFDAGRLELLGRDHSVKDAEEAVALCIEAGISNVSVDIIFGVSGQRLEDLESDLSVAAELPISHLSTYALTIEPGTPFFQRQERGLLKPPPDEIVAAMLECIPAYLIGHGFERYEISNYARRGQKSFHNEAYWTGRDYLGIGAGAHSFLGTYQENRRVRSVRWSTLALPDAYSKAAGTERVVSWREELTPESMHFEFFYLGLRRTGGVSLSEFEKLFGVAPRDRYGATLNQLQEEGFIEDRGDTIALTLQGISLADSVYERFIA